MKKIIRGICIAMGFLCFGLAMVGIALPLIPATPFVILAAFFFARGSKRFHSWFIGTQMYKSYVEDVVKNKSMTKKAKTKLMITLTVIFIIGFIASPIWHAKVVILIVAMFHYYYFLVRIKTEERRKEQCFTSDC